MSQTGREEITVFAKTNFRNKEVPFGIKTDDRRRHMYLIGKTGMGKTTMMENMVIQDIRNGHGVAFLDPHGDSVQRILNCVPNNRVNDVVYFNPADMEYPLAFNILEAVDAKYKHLVASGLMGVFTKIWANLWSARMEYILNNTILALLDSPGNTLLGITRMYVDKKYRKKIVDNIKDPMVRAFWTDEFANYNEKYRTEAIAPIQNKVGQFLSSAIIRNIVGQPKSTIDLREIMDKQKILIMDLSKGKVGEDNSALLGAMVVTKLQLAAMSRTDIPEHERKDFYLYVDEFQNFATESFATILSEARKYRLNLVVGHQYMGQLVHERNTKVKDAILGNVGTMVVYRIGAEDAEILVKEFEPVFEAIDMVNLPKYNIILKLMINGVASEPFSAITLPPSPDFVTGNSEKVIKVSRERYTNPVHEVEDKISRWMGAEFHQESAMLIGEAAEESVSAPNQEPQVIAAPIKPENIQKAEINPAPEQTSQEIGNVIQPQPVIFANPIEVAPKPVENKQEAVQSSAAPLIVQQPEKTVSENNFPEKTNPVVAYQENHNAQQRETRSPLFRSENRTHKPHKPHASHGHSSHSSHYKPHHKTPSNHHVKKENPIWDTVASLQKDKRDQDKKMLGRIFDSNDSHKTVQSNSQAVNEQDRQNEQSQKNNDNNTDGKKVLNPGESHKF